MTAATIMSVFVSVLVAVRHLPSCICLCVYSAHSVQCTNVCFHPCRQDNESSQIIRHLSLIRAAVENERVRRRLENVCL